MPDLESYGAGDYLTDALTDQAIEFIEQSGDRPFFLCLAHYAVHTPIQAPKELVEKYKAKREKMYGTGKPEQVEEKYHTLASVRQEHPAYAAMMENLDDNIGRVMEHLKEQGLLEHTIVVFTADNGGLAHRKREVAPTSNAPYRSGKAWTYDGGIRIPAIISWPGKIRPATSSARMITMDMYPTLLDLCGIPLKPEQHLDGKSLKALLAGRAAPEVENRVLAWTYPHVHGSGHQPSDALLSGDWKLIRFLGDEPTELYHLSEDVGEQHNLARQHPEKVRELENMLDEWLAKTRPE